MAKMAHQTWVWCSSVGLSWSIYTCFNKYTSQKQGLCHLALKFVLCARYSGNDCSLLITIIEDQGEGQALDDNSLVTFAAQHEDLRFCQPLLPACHLYSLALGENSCAPPSSLAEQGSCWFVVLTTLLIFHGAWTFTNCCPGAASATQSGETMGHDCDQLQMTRFVKQVGICGNA